MSQRTSEHPGLGYWRLITAAEPSAGIADHEMLRAWAGRLARWTTPALAAYAFEPAAKKLGWSPVNARAAQESLLFNRYTRARQGEVLRGIGEAGIEVVVLKGFAVAHQLYPDPDPRVSGDLDILVRERDRDRLLGLLETCGFRFPGGTPRSWGPIATGSYPPLLSADDAIKIDVHLQPDAYPIHRAMTTDAVFAAARRFEASGVEILAPSPEHGFLLLVSNTAKDKFYPVATKKILDALVLLRSGTALDWGRIEGLARRGSSLKPLRVFLALLGDLGFAPSWIPEGFDWRPGGLVAGEYRRMLAVWGEMPSEKLSAALTPLQLLRREALLSAEPAVTLYNNWTRARGMIRTRSEKGRG